MPHLDVADLAASYGATRVLDGITLSVEKGVIVSLIGPSGSGKSTLLRVLVGLLVPERGAVSLGGQRIDYRDRQAVRAVRDKVAIVFQQFNLFQNMTVLDNVRL